MRHLHTALGPRMALIPLYADNTAPVPPSAGQTLTPFRTLHCSHAAQDLLPLQRPLPLPPPHPSPLHLPPPQPPKAVANCRDFPPPLTPPLQVHQIWQELGDQQAGPPQPTVQQQQQQQACQLLRAWYQSPREQCLAPQPGVL